MDNEQAADIVRQLADGLDPNTGEPLARDSACQHPQVVRALFVARQALEGAPAGGRNNQKNQENQKKKPDAEHAGHPWSEDEDHELAAAHDTGTPVKDLALRHKRTVGAIQARLVKLGRVPATTTRFRV